MSQKKKQALDRLLLGRGMTATLQEARSLIMAGKVVVDDHRVDKPGTPTSPSATIRIKGETSRYVGRGGEKIAGPIQTFNIPLTGKTILDVGASTGGFTDCLLQHGAEKVFAVDVGYGQLAWKLQQDKRVVRLDRTNIRSLVPTDLQPLPDMAVVDASFTSLKGLLPHIIPLIQPSGEILALVKPQFEVKKEAVGRGGIVRDQKRYRDVLKDLIFEARSQGLHIIGTMESPIQGQKGNREFFLYLHKITS